MRGETCGMEWEGDVEAETLEEETKPPPVTSRSDELLAQLVRPLSAVELLLSESVVACRATP